MAEHTEQTALADAVPARIQLDDFIEAVTRGVTRALAAEDEVSGYAVKSVRPSITVMAGFFPFPTNPYPFDDLSGGAGGGGGGTVRGVRQ